MSNPNMDGNAYNWEMVGTTVYTGIIITVNLKVRRPARRVGGSVGAAPATGP